MVLYTTQGCSYCAAFIKRSLQDDELQQRVLLTQLLFAVRGGTAVAGTAVGPEEVAMSLFGPYLIGVELASFLLLAGLVGAAHLGVGIRERGGGS